jgi:multicomponent K+:H+ antiporter subunit E
MIVCITPGTSWAELSRDRSMLLLHVLEVAMPSHRGPLQARYERPADGDFRMNPWFIGC